LQNVEFFNVKTLKDILEVFQTESALGTLSVGVSPVTFKNSKKKEKKKTQFIDDYLTDYPVNYAVAQLVEALRYKPEGYRFDTRWRHWNFSLT